MEKRHIHIYFFLIILFISSCTINSNAPVVMPDINTIDIEGEEDDKPQQIQEEEPVVMVYYEEPVLNIFFHSLVARPETAFTCRLKDHYLEWYVTAGEYKKILYELYRKDYVLVDIKELYEVTYTDGRKNVNYKKPYIPEGKKPMVFSVDDLNYYENDRLYATIHKLVIDSNNRIAGWTASENGGELSYDLDVITYMEEFIRMYPDFSVRGARGIIALTGFEGVLGYKTHKLNSPEYETEKENAIKVVNRLKQIGWHFASHSWGHRNMQKESHARVIEDINFWVRDMHPIIGDTDLFIYPFGDGVENWEGRHKVLRDRNFNVFFGVGLGFTTIKSSNYIYFDRRNIDGFYFRVFKNRSDRLFNMEDVIDAEARMGRFPIKEQSNQGYPVPQPPIR